MTANKNETPKPVPLPVAVAGIPDELRAVPQWVCWKYCWRKSSWAKFPIRADKLTAANVADPSTWSTFEKALKQYQKQKQKLAGIGFVFAAESQYSGIDLDDCRNADTGALEPWAQAIVEQVKSYSEVSPSGTGLKIFIRGKLPPESRRRKEGNIEMYSDGRFFTVTGCRVPEALATVEARQEELVCLYNQVFGRKKVLAKGHLIQGSDAGLIAKAMRAENGEKFVKLWYGDTSGYSSESEADLALASMLAYWLRPNADFASIEQLFSQSTLGKREKWLERADYRERTICKAIDGLTVFPSTSTRINRTIKTIKTNRSHQEQSGFLNTEVLLQPAHVEQKPLPPELRERAEEIAIALAETNGEEPDWQVMFILAKELHHLSAEEFFSAQSMEPAVIAFCKRVDKPAEDYWYAFRAAWDKVKFGAGKDVLEWAANKARSEPVLPTTPMRDKYVFVASFAWHLADLCKPKPIMLPLERIAALLNTSAKTVSNVIHSLKQDGIIRCVDEDYSFTKHRAKEYLFTGQGFRPMSVEEVVGAGAA